mgnify:FL=1
MMKNNFLIGLILTALFVGCNSKVEDYNLDISTYASPQGTDIYKPDSSSLAQNYIIPDWFKDAKLGVFIHWGVYAVPAFGNEWYPRNMYRKGTKVYDNHIKTYGSLTEFGY